MQKKHNELKDLKQFGIALAGISLVFGTIHFMRHRMVPAQWFFGAGLFVFFISLLAPGMLRPVYKLFLKAAHAIGWFNTRVILILIYFLLVTPIAIIMKIIGKDLLGRKIDKGASTYWVKRPATAAAKEQLERQF